MKHLSALLLNMLIISFAYCQIKKADCKCPPINNTDNKADTVFHLSGGKAIILCGYRETEAIEGKILFSEFVLSTCGSNKIINSWGADELCRIGVVKDTLFVEGIVNLPTGKHFNYRPTVWTIERIYYAKGKEVQTLNVSRRFPKYNQAQIESVIKLYQQTPAKINDTTMNIADKLFVSTISGSQKARKCLKGFRDKFKGIDGDYLEQYESLTAMLELWDSKTHHLSH